MDAIDLAISAVSGNTSESYRKAEALEERNRGGKNTVIAQALQGFVDVGTGDTDTYIDNKAETGERGVWPAYGNAVGGLWSDAIHGERSGGYFTDADQLKREHDNMHWYNPFSW